MGSWLFGKKPGQAPAAALRIQSSQQGVVKPVVWGTTRITGNIIWYGDFSSSSSSSGGKGAGSGAGGKSGAGSGTNYFVSVAIGLCEGPIADVLTCWNNKSVGTAASFGFSKFLGDYAQTAWGYLTTKHPDQALNYRGDAYAAQSGFALGTSPEVPQLGWEIKSTFSGVNGTPDADPKDVVVDGCTNPHYGVGFPAFRLDTAMAQYSAYCRATGMLVSPAATSQREFSAFLVELFAATNSSPRWSSGILSVVPWGDAEITGNGVTYTPQVTPLYDVTADDLLPNEGSIGSGMGTSGAPIICVHNRQSDMINSIKVEFLDRTNNYDPNASIEAKDQASIDTFGLRAASLKQVHMFCTQAAAQMSASLQLALEQIPNTYIFTVGPSFILPDVEDILTLTKAEMGMLRQPVRITEIQENDSGTLTFTAEEFLGTASPPLYGRQASAGYVNNTNADPGLINPPLIFEPPDELGDGLEIWGAISGIDTAIWGGCDVYVSSDGVTYDPVGTITGAARMGVLSAPLASVTPNPTGGQTIDTGNTLSVDLTESAGALGSGSDTDFAAFNTRCVVDTEVIAYENAALTAANKYNLTRLNRGGYGSTISAHAAGAPFARLDRGIFTFPYDQSRIGATVYFKFLSFNIWGGGEQSLANVPAYPYVITGTALYSPLPDIANLRTAFDVNSGFTELDWDVLNDFRTPQYEIRSGTSPTAAMTLGTVAHPPFRVPGDGTYWISAVAEPASGRKVYSQTWQSITVAGAIITQNVMLAVDLKALNWPGVFSGGAGIDNSLNAIRSGGGNILTDANILTTPDVLNYGAGTSLAGIYYPDDHAFLDLGYVAPASVSILYQPTGVPVGQNILGIGNVLTTPDMLGSASTQFIDNYPLINTATAAGGDLYGLGDLYFWPDLYAQSDAAWNGFQKFTPGTYQTRFLYFGFNLQTLDPGTIAYNLALTITVTIPARVDQYAVVTSASADTTITFQPTGAASPAPFNGGAGASLTGGYVAPGLPVVSDSIVNKQAGDDFIITALTLSAISFKIVNGGSRVVRNLSLLVEGF